MARPAVGVLSQYSDKKAFRLPVRTGETPGAAIFQESFPLAAILSMLLVAAFPPWPRNDLAPPPLAQPVLINPQLPRARPSLASLPQKETPSVNVARLL